jgi:hypothetical protein
MRPVDQSDILSLFREVEDEAGLPPPAPDLSKVSDGELERELVRRAAAKGAMGPAGITSASTVEEARLWLRAQCIKGSRCPVCTRLDKRYHRPLNRGMALTAVWMWRHAPDGRWINMPTEAPKHLLAKCRDFTLMVHWGLIEPRVNDDASRSGSGDWRVLPHLGQWLRGEILVPSHVWLYQDDLPVLDDSRMVAVGDALPDFDLEKLMRGDT